MVATVLHLDEGAWQALLQCIQTRRHHLADRHDIADRDFVACCDISFARTIERRACVQPDVTPHLVVIADNPIDFRHVGEHLCLRLRRAAGDDDAC